MSKETYEVSKECIDLGAAKSRAIFLRLLRTRLKRYVCMHAHTVYECMHEYNVIECMHACNVYECMHAYNVD